MKNIEEQIEDNIKQKLVCLNLKYYCKTESVNPEIDKALKDSPSKSGGKGCNYPDIKLLINDIPVMIEVKGSYDDLIKFDISTGHLDMRESAVVKYAVNGANHYARCIVNNSSYKECYAIGIVGNKGPLDKIYTYLVFCKVCKDKQTVILKQYKQLSDIQKL